MTITFHVTPASVNYTSFGQCLPINYATRDFKDWLFRYLCKNFTKNVVMLKMCVYVCKFLSKAFRIKYKFLDARNMI